ncbi:MAG: flavin reductase family protein [Psychroflexus sp.]|uniref:flavin reductase family protein n=1 Tax=Psychroflexus sp. S27 TaxID=1982757 RepID=UPI000C2A79D2|nr:flavin reductase [Psychroflexus sp. S27]PJX28463.1 flavin oxidoreductase [Psychroflexus sp. S27]
MQYSKNDLEQLDRKYRLNLINSISGVKPANLIGTKSEKRQENLAIFSSVVHLGSSPAQLGFVMRPQTDEIKDTYANIQKTGYYTINHVGESFVKKAHYTSAKLKKEESEFERMNIEKIYLHDFHAPFVKKSQVKMGMKLTHQIPLPNDCIFMIGEVVLLDIAENITNKKGQIDLSASKTAGISGLNTYYALNKIDNFPYVRTNEIPDFNE